MQPHVLYLGQQTCPPSSSPEGVAAAAAAAAFFKLQTVTCLMSVDSDVSVFLMS